MFEVAFTWIKQFIDLLPSLIAVYVLFDLMGSILFGRGY